MESEAIIQTERDLDCLQTEMKGTESVESFTYL